MVREARWIQQGSWYLPHPESWSESGHDGTRRDTVTNGCLCGSACSCHAGRTSGRGVGGEPAHRAAVDQGQQVASDTAWWAKCPAIGAGLVVERARGGWARSGHRGRLARYLKPPRGADDAPPPERALVFARIMACEAATFLETTVESGPDGDLQVVFAK